MSSASPESIISTTYDLMRALRHNLACADGGAPVNFLQMHALAVIDAKSGITMKELADMLHVTSPTATSFVERLVKGGFVLRDHDPDNRKLVRLRVTDSGREEFTRQKSLRTSAIKSVLSVLTQSELDALSQILEKLHQAQTAQKSS